MFAPYYSYDTVHIINKKESSQYKTCNGYQSFKKQIQKAVFYIYYLIVKLHISTRNKYFQ